MKQVLKDLKINNDDKNKSFVMELMSKPPKEKPEERPKFKNSVPFNSVMADLLFLPNDKGYKYLLTTVDLATRTTDAEPLKSKTAKDIIEGFKKIFKRKYMKIPNKLLCDDGTEFNNKAVIKFFNGMNCLVRVAAPGRSRSQSLIETYNNFYGTIYYMKMNNEEINTGEESNEWVYLTKDIVEAFNKHLTKKPVSYANDETLINSLKTTKPYDIGTEVHVQLNKPRSIVDNKRLHGKFRASDLKYTVKPHRIIDYYFDNTQPVLYVVDGFKNNVFSKGQLKQIDEKTKNNTERRKYTIEKILKKIKINGKYYYKIKWLNFPNNTNEPVEIIKQDVPQLVREFEHKNKK